MQKCKKISEADIDMDISSFFVLTGFLCGAYNGINTCIRNNIPEDQRVNQSFYRNLCRAIPPCLRGAAQSAADFSEDMGAIASRCFAVATEYADDALQAGQVYRVNFFTFLTNFIEQYNAALDELTRRNERFAQTPQEAQTTQEQIDGLRTITRTLHDIQQSALENATEQAGEEGPTGAQLNAAVITELEGLDEEQSSALIQQASSISAAVNPNAQVGAPLVQGMHRTQRTNSLNHDNP